MLPYPNPAVQSATSSAKSSIHLPLEILSEVFRHAKPRREPSSVLPTEVVLSHVSFEWRNAILSDRKIWSTINIHSPKSLPRAHAYLSRSGSIAPLHIRVEVYDYDRVRDTHSKKAFVKSVNDFIKSCIQRCKTLLVFTYRQSTCCEMALGLQSLSAPNLERLRINTVPREEDEEDEDEDDGDDVPMSQSNIFTQSSPHLRFLEIEGAQTFPPLGNIITLHLHNLKKQWFTLQAFEKIAKDAPRLQHLSLESNVWALGNSWLSVDLSLGPVITFKSLKALKINETAPGFIHNIVLAVNTPRLESLWLSPSNEGANLDHLLASPQFASVDHKFKCVKYLTLEAYNMRTPEKWNQVFPNIEHFFVPEAPMPYVSSRWFGDAFSSNPPLWPKLKTLALMAKSSRRQISLKEQLCRIVSNRAEMRVGLKKILSDSDIVGFLRKQESDLLSENVDLEVMDTENYREPWWLLMHESHPDSIGLS